MLILVIKITFSITEKKLLYSFFSLQQPRHHLRCLPPLVSPRRPSLASPRGWSLQQPLALGLSCATCPSLATCTWTRSLSTPYLSGCVDVFLSATGIFFIFTSLCLPLSSCFLFFSLFSSFYLPFLRLCMQAHTHFFPSPS